MKKRWGWKRKITLAATGFIFMFSMLVPGTGFAETDVEVLKKQLEEMTRQMEMVQKKLEAIEAQKNDSKEEIKELDERLNKAELHTATDKLSLGVYLRSRADSLHYQNIRLHPVRFQQDLSQTLP